MANIPVLDLRPQLLSIKGEIMAAVEAVIDSTAYINGPATQQFEKEAAQDLLPVYGLSESPHKVSAEAAAQVMSLPIWPELTPSAQKKVTKSMRFHIVK